MNVNKAPIKEQLMSSTGDNSPIWNVWFNRVAEILGPGRNVKNVSWSPAITGITYSGSGTVTGVYTQNDDIVSVNVIIDAGAGTSTSVLNTTKVTNLPKKAGAYGSGRVFQETGKVDFGSALIMSGGTELYLPAWSCTGKVIVIANYITSE